MIGVRDHLAGALIAGRDPSGPRRRVDMVPLRYRRPGCVVLALAAGLWTLSTQPTGGQQKQVPRFIVEPGWPKPGPRSWVTERLITEEMGATCADAKGNVVALNRGNMLPIEASLT